MSDARLPRIIRTAAPEDVVDLLREYHTAMGAIVFQYEGTVGPLAGDRLMILLNDPLPADSPSAQAVGMALAMRDRMLELASDWRRRGLEAELAVGIDQGYATLGTMEFEGKQEYGAIGTVVHIASALCDRAVGGQILASQRVVAELDAKIATLSLGESQLLGLTRPVHTFEIVGRHAADEQRRPVPTIGAARPNDSLSPREREVVALIARGYSNRRIAEELVIAEGTAVRHVANVLNKLDLRTRAQVAVLAVTHDTRAAD